MNRDALFPPQEALGPEGEGVPHRLPYGSVPIEYQDRTIDPEILNIRYSTGETGMGLSDNLEAASVEDSGADDGFGNLMAEMDELEQNAERPVAESAQVDTRYLHDPNAATSAVVQYYAPQAPMISRSFAGTGHAIQHQDWVREQLSPFPRYPEDAVPQSSGPYPPAPNEHWSRALSLYEQGRPHDGYFDPQLGTGPLFGGPYTDLTFGAPLGVSSDYNAFSSIENASPCRFHNNAPLGNPLNDLRALAQPPTSPDHSAPVPRKNPRSGTKASIRCIGRYRNGDRCVRTFVPKDPNNTLCSRCVIKHRRANPPLPRFAFPDGIYDINQAKAMVFPIRTPLVLSVVDDDEQPTQEECDRRADEIVRSLMAAAQQPYLDNTPHVEGAPIHRFHLNQQHVFSGKMYLDIPNNQVVTRMRLLYQTIVVLHLGGETVYPDGGDNGGYGNLDRSLGFWKRIDKIKQVLRVNKRIALDVIEGRGVAAFVGNPDKFQRRKTQNKESNTRKQKKQALADQMQAKLDSKGKSKRQPRRERDTVEERENDDDSDDENDGDEDGRSEGEEDEEDEEMFRYGEGAVGPRALASHTPQRMSQGRAIATAAEGPRFLDRPLTRSGMKRKRGATPSAAATRLSPRRPRKAKLSAHDALVGTTVNSGEFSMAVDPNAYAVPGQSLLPVPQANVFGAFTTECNAYPPGQQAPPAFADTTSIGASAVEDDFNAGSHDQIPDLPQFNATFAATQSHEDEYDGRVHRDFDFDDIFKSPTREES